MVGIGVPHEGWARGPVRGGWISLAELGRVLLAAAGRRTGWPVVLAVAGRSSSGKTTSAGRLAAEVSCVVVLHTDDIAWRQAVTGLGSVAPSAVCWSRLRRGQPGRVTVRRSGRSTAGPAPSRCRPVAEFSSSRASERPGGPLLPCWTRQSGCRPTRPCWSGATRAGSRRARLPPSTITRGWRRGGPIPARRPPLGARHHHRVRQPGTPATTPRTDVVVARISFSLGDLEGVQVVLCGVDACILDVVLPAAHL